MEKNSRDTTKDRRKYSSLTNIVVILLNILLISGAFMMYVLYSSVYQDRLQEENIGNIKNLNQSAAANAISTFKSWNIKLDDLALHMGLDEDMTYEEALDMISETNSSEERIFELIGGDYTGYLARKENGAYPFLDYRNSSYESLQTAFDDIDDDDYGNICFTPEFTDSGAGAAKLFAVYKHIPLINEEGEREIYTLMLAARSKDVLAIFNSQNDFTGQATVLTDSEGDYIISNPNFKSTNFFQYLYVYNDLSMDQKMDIKKEMAEKKAGELYYKNAEYIVEECVFCYEEIGSNGWYSITSVPVSAFRAPVFNTTYIVYAIIMLLALFAIDVVWLQGMNRRLRISMRHEREANAAKGNFMSRMSHEIRTPLNAVIGYNTIAQNEMTTANNDEERRHAEMKVMDCLSKSDIASKHLLSIINDVLDMSAIENGKIKVAHDNFDFKGLITSLTTIFYSQAKAKGVDFEVIFNTLTEEWFVGDQMRTNQILTNLLSNAVKFTPEGGRVTLTIYQPEAENNASHIHFQVKDTGIGMSKEYLKNIWTPFEQADSSISRRFGGTGLGLSITKNLIDIMGGTITVDSQPGEGTTFEVDLTFEELKQQTSESVYNFDEINALVVDDDASTCEYIRMLFNRYGARCATVTSGIDAIEAVTKANADGDNYTLCLVDWSMPQMDGIETAKGIRNVVGDDIPIIVLTAYDYSEIAAGAAEAGINRFISKPLFQSTLFDLLANISNKPMPPRKESHSKSGLEGVKVLLAEDNVMNMEIAKRIMEAAGITVDSAWNGREALDMFTGSASGTYGAVLMDVHMPVMNGYEATKSIRNSSHEEAKTIPIIAMTADAFAENVAEALDSGMNDHIAKPIDVQVLFEKLKMFTDR